MQAHEDWVRSKLADPYRAREEEWSSAIAVGRRAYVEQVQRDLGARGRYRRIEEENGSAVLRDADGLYTPRFVAETLGLSSKITLP